MLVRKLYISLIAGGLALSSLPVFAQSVNSVDTRLDRMEREMQTLSRSVYKGDVPPPQMRNVTSMNGGDTTAATELRLNQMEEQLRKLTGMIEENGYRLRQMESKIQNAPAVASTTPSPSPSTPIVPNDTSSSLVVDNQPYQLGTITNSNANTPAGLYDQAFSFMQSNDYAGAQAEFEKFLNQYPDHSLAANAKYWLAETHYARGDYKAASQGFARSFKDHPDGQKAPDTLLKLAMSLKAQDMNQEACLTLGELQNRFPNAPLSVSEKAESEMQAYGCGA